MKATGMLLIGLMIVGLFGPCVIVAAEASVVPHEDPNEAQSTLDSLSFLTEYANIFGLMSSGQYGNASQLSEQLSYITVPEDLSYVLNRYNNLTQQLIAQLTDLDATLNQASKLLDQNRLDEAHDALEHAGIVVAKAEIILSDLRDATSTVGQKLGALSAAAGNRIQQAYSELQGMLDRLQSLIDRYHSLLETANQKYETIKSEDLNATSITLVLNATECFVGGYVSVSGTLSSDSQTLANREVTLLFNAQELLTVNTNSNGSYSTSMQIPYAYVDSAAIGAYYAPTGKDKNTYLGAVSPTVTIKVLYYHTVLNVSTPTFAYPGLPLIITGSVLSQNSSPLAGRQVKLLLDGEVIAKITTESNGSFSTQSTISASAKLGSHSLTVIVEPNGLYSGISVTRTLTMTKMATTVEVSEPSFVILPAQFEVSGTVKAASGPLYGATVVVEFANITTTTRTNSDGSFNITFNVPITSVLVGGQTLQIVAQPTQSWQASASRTFSIFVLNLVSIGLMLTASLAVVFVLCLRFTRKSKKASVLVETTVKVPAVKSDAPVIIPAVVAVKKREGLAGRVVNAYVEAISAIQSATDLSATPITTLREYLELASPKLHDAMEPFSELTALTEFALYSMHQIDESAVRQAEEIASTIRRILNGVA